MTSDLRAALEWMHDFRSGVDRDADPDWCAFHDCPQTDEVHASVAGIRAALAKTPAPADPDTFSQAVLNVARERGELLEQLHDRSPRAPVGELDALVEAARRVIAACGRTRDGRYVGRTVDFDATINELLGALSERRYGETPE